LQNLGGIGNLTAIPPRATVEEVNAFDTGPGNMVMDAIAQRLFHQAYDRNGAIAARGRVLEAALHHAIRTAFFQQKPPRTAGREQFGREFVQHLIQWCRTSAQRSFKKEDILATATALTAAAIEDALRRFVLRRNSFQEFIVSGGGAKNCTLMRMIE